ncbi:MAG: Gfo/Idh/MocA family oxidoreductase [Planctomycetaceae bacterium]
MSADDLMHRDLNRRQFLGRSAGIAVGAVGVGGGVVSAARSTVDTIGVGVVGVRRRGLQLAEAFAALPGVAVNHLCDVDAAVLGAAGQKLSQQGRPTPSMSADVRAILEDPNVNVVVIATPDHWHTDLTLAACAAGKDVYVEAPLTHSLAESERLRKELDGTPQIVGCGLQQRSCEHFQSAIDYVRSGQLGTVRLARAWAVARRQSLPIQTAPVVAPAGVDYSAWLGPMTHADMTGVDAKTMRFSPQRFHHHWRWQWDFGSGELGTWGVHLLDVARWGLNVQRPLEVVATGGVLSGESAEETPDTLHAQWTFSDAIIAWEHRSWTSHGVDGRSNGVAFHGDAGTLIVDRGGWKVYGQKEGASAAATPLLEPHLMNFLEAVRSRTQPASPLEAALDSADLCHLANAAYRCGQKLSLAALR